MTGVIGDDYDSACAVDEVAVIQFGEDGRALVLSDEPARTTYYERLKLFVQWIWADPGRDVEQAVSAKLRNVVWEPGPTVDVGGSMMLPGSSLSAALVRDPTPCSVVQ